MDIKLENELYNEDPIFFEDAIACQSGEKNEMDTCMYYGCECGDGWFKPLKSFAHKMYYLNKLAKQYNMKIVCAQLKEKYARCTIYFDIKPINPDITLDDNIMNDIRSIVYDFINICEEECAKYCEKCGERSSDLDYTKGWVKLYCKKCRGEINLENRTILGD